MSPVGEPLSMNLATNYETRPDISKVRVEVDLTKPLLQSVWVGQEDESNPLKGITQKLEYEGVPKYCKHCWILCHSIVQCRILEKERQKEKEAKNKELEEKNANSEKNQEDVGNQKEFEASKTNGNQDKQAGQQKKGIEEAGTSNKGIKLGQNIKEANNKNQWQVPDTKRNRQKRKEEERAKEHDDKKKNSNQGKNKKMN